jgi:hypothetical protein
MIRQLVTSILLACLLFGFFHFGEEEVAPGAYAQAGCSIVAGYGMDVNPCHDENGGCQDGHCCGTHHHVSAIAGQRYEFSHPMHKKQFIALASHFSPSDHRQERFIPPKHTA